MKASKLSLAVLLALGTFTFATAEETATKEAETQTEELKPAEGKTLLLDALKGTTVSGYAHGRVTGSFGNDASGAGMRTRIWVDVDTGSFYGFSMGTRLFYSQGSGGPNGGSFLANSTGDMSLKVLSLYGKQTFSNTTTTVTAGKMNLSAPFSDGNFDYGYGVGITNADLTGVKFSLQGYGAWQLDSGLQSDRPMFIFGIDGDRSKLAGVGFKAYVAHILQTVDFTASVGLDYKFAGLTIGGQVAVSQVNTSSKDFSSVDTAKLRGLYNIQASYDTSKDIGLSIKAGFTGSFGDGYGALFNYAAFNMGGQFWFDMVGENNGYGLNGVGGKKGTDILVGYAGIQYKGVTNLSVGLDYAYIGGNNNYALTNKGIANRGTTNMNAQLHEVSFTAGYNFSKHLSLSGLVGSTFGDLTQARARTQLTYSF